MPAPEHPRAASVAEATPQQALATVYDEGAVAYERYWALVLHRHAVELVDAVPAAEPQTGLTVVGRSAASTNRSPTGTTSTATSPARHGRRSHSTAPAPSSSRSAASPTTGVRQLVQLVQVVLAGVLGMAERMADGSVDTLNGDDFYDLPKYW